MSAAEELVRKKGVRGGHRGSATKMMGQLDSELATSSPDPARILQLRRSLEEKIDTLKTLDVANTELY